MSVQATVIEELIHLIRNSDFQNRHKIASNAFTRNRKLTFDAVAGMILRLIKKSLQISCNWLGSLSGGTPASKQAFSTARQKISAECFQELQSAGIKKFYTSTPKEGLWKGYRIIGADGSTLRLPESKDLETEFGRGPSAKDAQKSPPMARISEFKDLTTRLTISGRIAPYNVSEEALAEEQLVEVVQRMRDCGQKQLLFVYDRGYPSEKFINLHLELGVDFIFRVPRNFNKAVQAIRKEGETENMLIAEGWPLLRVVQFELSSGEEELLLTSLTDSKEFPKKSLSEVYHSRWIGLEEGYKRQKITMQMENFSGKTAVAVRQEYWATLTVANILEMGCVELEGCWIPENLPEKHVNRSVVFGSMRDSVIEVLFGLISPDDYKKRFNQIAQRAMLKLRPNRSYSRESLHKPKKFHVYRRSC